VVNDYPAEVVYEQPLTERVRTFLRLEFLFAQHRHHHADGSEFGARATLQTLLDILVVLSRTDLKNEILKELADQVASLSKLTSKPGVDPARLKVTLQELASAQQALAQTTPFAATALRGHDFLISILNRTTVPGGATAFDLPTFHHWLSQPDKVRRDLANWYGEIMPFETAISLYLRLLRMSTKAESVTAAGGMYVRVPQGACSLLRVVLQAGTDVYPEISAGKHRFSVRLMRMPDAHSRPQQTMDDVRLSIQCCNL
jgi:cell division protein ZapD